jgi:hypothetical protein
MEKNKSWLEEWKNPWFWFYVISMVLIVILFNLNLKIKTLQVALMFSFPIIQLIYNLKFKLSKEEYPFGNYIRWGLFWFLLLLSVSYLALSLNETQIAVTLIIFIMMATLILTSLINLKILCKSKRLSGAIIAYLIFAFTIVVSFGLIYSISGAFENNGVLNPNGNLITSAWDFVYFSSTVFYSQVMDYSPNGFSKIIVIVELSVSAIIHIFLIGILIPKLKNSPLFK